MPRVQLLLCWALPAIAATSVGFALAGCQSNQQSADKETLAALEMDPLASFRPAGAIILVDLRAGGITGNKPVPARLLRVFGFKDSGDADGGRRAAVDAASTEGWDIGPSNRPSRAKAYFGAKSLPTGHAMVEIRQYKEEGVDKLSIRLEHTPCPSILCGDE